MEEMQFEREMDMPEGWESNVILCRMANGAVVKMDIPDDDDGDDGNA